MIRRVTLVAALLGVLSACGAHGLSFKLDERVAIVSPRDHATVTLPLTIAWDVKDAALRDGPHSFGVVIDRSPPPSGKTLEWLFRDDDSCGQSGCTAEYRKQHGVLRTDDTKVTLDEIPARSDDADHEVTVILLDAQGRRAGEGAWSHQFSVEGQG